jgi:hypothetical protein
MDKEDPELVTYLKPAQPTHSHRSSLINQHNNALAGVEGQQPAAVTEEVVQNHPYMSENMIKMKTLLN